MYKKTVVPIIYENFETNAFEGKVSNYDLYSKAITL